MMYSHFLRSGQLLKCLFVLLLCGWIPVSIADAVFTATIPVASSGAEDRQAAFAQGLQIVAQRMVVDAKKLMQADSQQKLQSALQAAESYVDSYRYVTNDDTSVLIINYNYAALSRFLVQQGIEVWAGQRPATLLWLIQDDSQHRFIEDGHSDSIVTKSLQEHTLSRGIPLVFPVLDLQDQTQVSESDVWGLFADPILKASHRYNDYSVLAGRVLLLPSGKVTGRWLYLLNGQRYTQSMQKVSVDAFVSAGVALMGNHLSHLLIVDADHTTQRMRFQITGIHNLNAYSDLLHYLHNLPRVQRVQVQHLDTQNVTLTLYTDADQERLLALIKAQHRLLAKDITVNTITPDASPANTVGEKIPPIADFPFIWQG